MAGEPVQVIHATLFSRHSWVVLMVDLVAACSMNDGSYDGSSLVWKTPEVLYPLVSGRSSLASREVNMGVNGELLEQPITTERGYNMKKHDGTLQISIPYNAEGGYTESYVMDNLYHEVYVFHLYVEQIFVDENYVDTRLRLHRPLATPLVPRHVFTVNNTVLEERRFTVYIGDVPEDVELAAVALNGQDFSVPFTNMSSYTISNILQPNHTHGYTLSVPFEDPIVQRWAKEGVLQLILDINYTLTLLPENEPYYHLASIEALMDASPPAFEAVCSEKRITFKLDYRPFDYLWVVYVGSDMLTAELAAQKGYILHNDSQSLILDVPLYTDGYTHEDIGLKTFFGTFTLLIRDSKTLEVQGSSVKTCPFSSTGLILCSTSGKMTVVADMPMTIPSGMSASLLDKHCIPKEANDTRVLFSFGLNSCGSRVMGLLDRMIAEEESLKKRLLSSIQTCQKEMQTLCLELQLPVFEEDGGSMLQQEKNIRTRVEVLVKEKSQRMQQLKALVEQEQDLCDILRSIPYGIAPDSVPSLEQLENFRQHIASQTAEKEKRYVEFVDLKKQIILCMKDLDQVPETSFEKDIVCEDEESFCLSREDITSLKLLLCQLEQHKAENEAMCEAHRERIQALWDRLEVPQDERHAFSEHLVTSKKKNLEALQAEVQRLEELQLLNICNVIDAIRSEIAVLWEKCFLSTDQRQAFVPYFSEDFTEELLDLHDAEIKCLKQHYEEHKELFEGIHRWEESWRLYQELEIGPDTVAYVNEIVFSPKFATVKYPSPATEKVTLRCVYPLAGLHRLFSGLRFESDFPGVGSIVHDTVPVESSQQRILQPTFNPIMALQTTMSTTERPIKNLPALQSPVRYIRVFSFLRDLTRSLPKKGAQ